jgi:hypothetical protein
MFCIPGLAFLPKVMNAVLPGSVSDFQARTRPFLTILSPKTGQEDETKPINACAPAASSGKVNSASCGPTQKIAPEKFFRVPE